MAVKNDELMATVFTDTIFLKKIIGAISHEQSQACSTSELEKKQSRDCVG